MTHPIKRKNSASSDEEPEWFKKFKEECFGRIEEVKYENKRYKEMIMEELRQNRRNSEEIREDIHKILGQVASMITKMSGISTQQQTQSLPASTSTIDMVSPPKAATEKEKKAAVEDFIKKNLSEVNEERLAVLFGILKKHSLATCQTFALTIDESGNPNGEKEWKELNDEIQMGLLTSTLDKTVEEANELQFLRLCRGLWAVEFILQPKWSNLSRNRRKRKLRQLPQEGSSSV